MGTTLALPGYVSPYLQHLAPKERNLDKLAADWVALFPVNQTRQELFFNGGYAFEDDQKAITDLNEYPGGVWKRKEAVYHLMTLNIGLDKIAEESGYKSQHDLLSDAPILREKVEGFRKCLELCLFEHNKKFMLEGFYKIINSNVPSSWKDVKALQEEIQDA